MPYDKADTCSKLVTLHGSLKYSCDWCSSVSIACSLKKTGRPTLKLNSNISLKMW